MSIRDVLIELPIFDRPLPPFDPGTAPAHPGDMFADWLGEAAAAGVVEPHAMTLSTVDGDGRPDSRVVVLRELDEHGWHFATDLTRPKGRQLTANPAAAHGFNRREPGRQVRDRGIVSAFDRVTCAADFLARPDGARAANLAGHQSEVLRDPADLDRALTAAEETVRREPQTVDEHHTVYALSADSVEFWQGDATRRHVRLRYRLADGRWHSERLWP